MARGFANGNLKNLMMGFLTWRLLARFVNIVDTQAATPYLLPNHQHLLLVP